jgi:hypothetical protein
MEKEEGGTKIQRRQSPPPQTQMNPNQGIPQVQMNHLPEQVPMNQGPQQMMPINQGPTPEQIMMLQQMQQQNVNNMGRRTEGFRNTGGNTKSKFGNIGNDTSFRYSLLVVLIFIILNSKIVWRQLSRFPLMGSVEPSIIALIANSLLAGVIFYLISKLLNKN